MKGELITAAAEVARADVPAVISDIVASAHPIEAIGEAASRMLHEATISAVPTLRNQTATERSISTALPPLARNAGTEPRITVPFPDKPWVVGVSDRHGAWLPLRDWDKLPETSRAYIGGMYNAEHPMMQRDNVDALARALTPPLHSFTPVPRVETFSDLVAALGSATVPPSEAAAMKIAQARSITLNQSINTFGKHVPIPELGANMFHGTESEESANTLMYFSPREGEIGIRSRELLRRPAEGDALELRLAEGLKAAIPTDEFAGKVAHEITHSWRAYERLRVEFHRAGLEKWQATEPIYREKFMDAARKAFGRRPEPEYIQRVLKTWAADNRPVLKKDEIMADLIRDTHDTTQADGSIRNMRVQIKHTDGILRRLQAGVPTENILRDLRSPGLQKQIFGRSGEVPEPIKTILNAGTPKTGARDIIGDNLTRHVDDLNKARQQKWDKYFSSPEELEAWLVEMRVQQAASDALRAL